MNERKIRQMENLEEKTYHADNGIEIHYLKNPGIGSFSLSLFLRHGAMHDEKEYSGFSHFYEHAVFANIDKIMDGKLDETADLAGLCFNASTYYNYIEFVISGATKHFKLASEIISLVFSPFTLSKEKLKTEIKRIKAEIAENDPSSINELALKQIFDGTSLALPITGKCSDIDRYGTRLLSKKQKEMLSLGNVFFYAGGNFPDEGIKYLAGLVGKYAVSDNFPKRNNDAPVPKDFGKRDCKVSVRNSDSTSVLCAFDIETIGFSVPELLFFSDCISFDDGSSPIYRELSVKRGLIYSFDSDMTLFGNLGVLTISFCVRSDKLYESLEALFGIFRDAKENIGKRIPFVSPIYIDNNYAYIDCGDDISGTFGYENHILGCGHKTISEKIRAYSEVSEERLKKLAGKVFVPSGLSVMIKGNKKRIDVSKIKSTAYALLSDKKQ